MKIDPRVQLVGILRGCPFDAPLKECEFNSIRKESLAVRIRWLDSLNEKGQGRLLNSHVSCARKREEEFWR